MDATAGQRFWPGLGYRCQALSALSYQFLPHFHPYVAELIKRLVNGDLADLQAADTDYKINPDGSVVTLPDGRPRPLLYEELFTQRSYASHPDLVPDTADSPWPVKDLDFTSSGAYAVYNRELFYICAAGSGLHLSQNQRFEDVQKWFHSIFDPAGHSSGPTPARFWKIRPFQPTDVALIQDILVNLSTEADLKLKNDTIHDIQQWKNDPFRSFLVARFRQTAFLFKTVMAYPDNLIAWGDTLFQQKSGKVSTRPRRPMSWPPISWAAPTEGARKREQTSASLHTDLNASGDALRDVEASIPFDFALLPAAPAQTPQHASLGSVDTALYFCVPPCSATGIQWQNHQQQIANARDIEQFLAGERVSTEGDDMQKETSRDFYLWMKRQVKGLSGQTFQFAFDVARKAGRALQHELGDPQLSYLQTGYPAGREGLLAGEQFFQNIKRMERAYHDLNGREYEVTRHTSLLQLDPIALRHLRTTGRCTFRVPEALFDMDGPHYFRRIKTVALSLPCVVGPYTSVPCPLTLLKSSIRTTCNVMSDSSDYTHSSASIVTSSGQNDSG
jgi:hypothetical protein